MARKLDPSRTLAARFPTLAAQWHPERNLSGPERYEPDTIPASSPATAWWRCSEGHEWQGKVATRTAMPQWKNGDVAACPDCVRSPTRLVAHTYPGCGHTRTVQRKNAEKNQQSCWDCGGDPRPAKEAARRNRKRASALASYHRRKERGGPLTDVQRAAQRALVGFLNCAPTEITNSGVMWWRDELIAGIYNATTTDDLSRWLAALDVPHQIAMRRGQSSAPTILTGVHVAAADLREVERWAPRLVGKLRDEAERRRLTWGLLSPGVASLSPPPFT